MAAIDVGAVMQAIADTAQTAGVTTRVYAWPNDAASVPALIVGYPDKLDFDTTYQRGADRAEFPVWIICGRATERTTRDVLSALITGETGVKNALDGDLGGAVQTARVTACSIETVTLAGQEYLSAKFSVDVLT